MGLQEAIAELDGVDPSEFAQRLQEEASPFYKAIYSDGFGAGKTDQKSATQKAAERAEALEAEREELQDKVKALEEEQPEAAEVRGEYEEKLKRKQEQLNEANRQIEETKEQGHKALRAQTQEMFGERLSTFLASQGVEEDARKYAVFNAMHSDRVAFDDELNPVVYEPDGETPTPLSDGQAAHAALGESLMQNISDKHIRDGKPGATGANPTGARGANQMKREQFDDLSPAKQKDFVTDGGEVVD